jgi:hypothetical protein
MPKPPKTGGPIQTVDPFGPPGGGANGPAPGSHPLLPKDPALPPPPGAPQISAQEDPTLSAIDAQYAKYAEDLQNNTGRILNQATSATRDAMAGLRQQTGEDFALRGVGGGDAIKDVDRETGRIIAGQHADIARNREEQMLGALNARTAARDRAIGATQGEKRIGLDAYGMHNQAMQAYNSQNAQNAATAFDHLLATMQAQRSSPVTGVGQTMAAGPMAGPTTGGPYFKPGHTGFGGVRRR